MKKSQILIKRTLLFSLALVLLTASFLTIRAAGEVDPTFTAAVQETTRGTVQKIVVQPNGKIVAVGNFTVAGNSARTSVARFNADGSVDQSFNPPDFVGLSNGYVINAVLINAVAVQADGKVLIGGSYFRLNGQNLNVLLRLNVDGSLDSTFGAVTGTGTGASITDIKIQTDNKIVYSGSGQGLTRLNPNGSVDSSFQVSNQGQVDSFLIQADGKFIVNASSGIGIYRVNSNGTVDNSFVPASVTNVFTLALQSDGKILIGGGFSSVNGIQRGNVARLNTDGNLDPSFNPGGSGANSSVRGIDVLSDGRIVIGGFFTAFNGTSRAKNVRLNSDGTIDTSFNYNPGGNSLVYAVAANGNGGVILGGGDTGGVWNKLTRLNADGSLDTNFLGAIYHVGVVYQVLRQPDGKVLISGTFRKVNGISRFNTARLNSDGSLDTGFNATVSPIGYSLALQTDGKIIVGGNSLVRLNSDGSLDSSFQPAISPLINGIQINEVAVLPDGKIIIAGAFAINNDVPVAVARLNVNGSEDTTFNRVLLNNSQSGIGVYTMKIQPDGKIVVGGFFSQLNGANRTNLARLNTDGTLDTSFNLVFGVNGAVNDLALQSNGSIIIGGGFTNVNGATSYYLARLLPNVTLDTSFNPGPNAPVYAVTVQPDDKVLIGGVFDAIGGVPHSKITRLNSNGTIDDSFNINANDVVRNIQVSNDGKILVGGDFNRINGISSVGVARLLSSTAAARTPFDFDGDGRADVSVFRPSNGVWYLSQSAATNYGSIQFGLGTDKLVPADYDGDGKTDVAVVRNGIWYLQRSQAGFTSVQFGDANDVPVPADYDGDGRSDIAVFRPSNGVWYLLNSQAGFTSIAFGLGTDKPVPGDYNGDGKAEIAVFRPSNGYWYLSTNPATGFGGVQFGAADDKLVPADYDGDGKTDVAVFRPSNGVWYLLRSTAGFTSIAFGFGTDTPVAADYDGDGRADVAVFRGGNWYLNRTTQGFTSVAFGVADDKPVPYVFVR